MRAVFERKVWSECENGEWNWFREKTTVLQSRSLRVPQGLHGIQNGSERAAREDPGKHQIT